MRFLFLLLCVAATCSSALSSMEPSVTRAYVDGAGNVHIVTADGNEHMIKPKKWQTGAGFSDIKIASDGKTVGWRAEQMFAPFEVGTNYAYAIPLEIDVWRGGRVLRRFAGAQGIRNWIFLSGGDEVAFHTGPQHGQEFFDCALFEVRNGKQTAHWSLDRQDYVVPDWAKALLADDPPPGPDEIHGWFPDSPSPIKTEPPPQPK